MSDKLDQLFKNAFEGKKYEPPVQLWDNIAHRLDEKKKRKKILFWWSTAAAVVLFFALNLLLNFRKEKTDESMILYSDISATVIGLPKEETFRPEIAALLSQKRDFPVRINSDLSIRPFPVIEVEEKRQLITEGVKMSPLHSHNIKTHTIRTVVIPLVNQQAFENIRLYHKLLSENTNLQKSDFPRGKKKINLSLSGHFSPGYASGKYTSPDNLPRTYRYSSKQMEGIFSMSGGLKISLSSGKRLFFQTGLIYTQTGQRSKNRYYASGLTLYGIKENNAYVFSPLGRIKSNAGSNVYSALLTSLPMITSAASESSIEQVFGALEIPLSLKYKINDNRLSFTVLGGFSGSFTVSNKAYLNRGNKREYIGQTEDIRDFNISTDFSLGVEYPLTSKIKIMMEPGFRYYLQSVSRKEEINFKPYLFSFSTGIGIDF